LQWLTIVELSLSHEAQVRRAPCVRPPAQECQSVMRLNQHPAIRDGEIADASRRQHTSQLGKMRQLLRLFTDMFDHMVGKNDVKTVVREGQLRAVDQVKAIRSEEHTSELQSLM